ncbi:hypothetical protein DJ017_01110 [Phenylobacterium soli]|uniref:Uncharacterized protein n=1 Tax=Phenylobacterium soli TaxID=2170551 RepID=A0A328AED8_9CAUL|nr:hypothetical protein DJ017_01110 [Phenylobacterium soli]
MAALAAQEAAAKGARTPRLDGLWTNNSLTSLERDDELKTLSPSSAEVGAYEAKHLGKAPQIPGDTVGGAESEYWETDVGLARIRGQARSSWIVSPADGKIPYTAAAKAANKARGDRYKTNFDGPEARRASERCLTTEASGPPLQNGGYNDNYEIVQTPGAIAIYAEFNHDVRVIRMGRGLRHPPAGERRWMGDSIGHWEGRTLVVETTNFMPAEMMGAPLDPAEDMTVVERITPIAGDQLLYEFRVTDPVRFVQTWRGEMVLRRTKGPIYEYACHEGNYSMVNMLQGARDAEAAARKAGP